MRYHKLFIISILIAMACIIDTGRQWFHWLTTQKSIQELQGIQLNEKMQADKKMKNTPIQSVKKEKMMNTIFRLVESGDLFLQSISVIAQAETLTTTYDVNLVVSGHFQKIMQFFKLISSQCLPFFVDAIELYHQQDDWNLKIRLRILDYCVKGANTVFLNESYSNHLLRAPFFSVRQFKMAGFLKSQHDLSAIVFSPDKKSKEIRVGDFLGREKARVILIDENKVLVQVKTVVVPILKS